jgi:alpha-tubulin suppressor-like RCC1 family protein
VAASHDHTCGIKAADASLWCWGSNRNGQLGDGTTTDRVAPVQVSGGSAWTAVAVGSSHTCGIKAADASLWCWGSNRNGQLGDGTRTKRVERVQVSGGGVWADVIAGLVHTCAVQSGNASLWCWGSNDSGQLGNGIVLSTPTEATAASYSSDTPVQVSGFGPLRLVPAPSSSSSPSNTPNSSGSNDSSVGVIAGATAAGAVVLGENCRVRWRLLMGCLFYTS